MNNNFGKIEGNTIMNSLFGWSIKNSDGDYVYYNSNESRFVVVNEVIYELDDALQLRPVFKGNVNINDIVLYKNQFVHIIEIKSNGFLKGVSYADGTIMEFTTANQVDGKGYYQVVKRCKKISN